MCTATSAPKTSALVVRPNVAVTIDLSTPAGERAVLLGGIARLDTVDGVADEYREAAAKR